MMVMQLNKDGFRDRNTLNRGCIALITQLMRSEPMKGRKKMKVQEIKKHIDNGHHVTINNGAYKLIKDDLNQYLIICLSNNHCIGLTDNRKDILLSTTYNYEDAHKYMN